MNKQIFRAVLGAAVIIGIAALCAGCPTESGGGGGPSSLGKESVPDTWSAVKNISQLNGTWKGSHTYDADEDFSAYQANGLVHVSTKMDMTMIVDTTNNTITMQQTYTVTFSGDALTPQVWVVIKTNVNTIAPGTDPSFFPTVDIDEANGNHSIIVTGSNTGSLADMPADQVTAVQINQDGKKMKIPAGDNGGVEMIFTKQ